MPPTPRPSRDEEIDQISTDVRLLRHQYGMDMEVMKTAMQTLSKQIGELTGSSSEVTKAVQRVADQLVGVPGAEQEGLMARMREVYRLIYAEGGVLARLVKLELNLAQLSVPTRAVVESETKLKIVWSVLGAVGGAIIAAAVAKIAAIW